MPRSRRQEAELELKELEMEAGIGADGNGSRSLDWRGEQADFTRTMLDGALEYATEVIGHRAIPDVRDGLIPVQRRIVFAMDERGLHNNKPFAKSAETIGWVIGQYHPHGDLAAYGAMVRLAQPWVMTLPLVQGQGNWGNYDGKPAAANRYTEARLSKAASDCVRDLDPEIVPYQPNFTEKKREATVLPMIFPSLVVNGAEGIAWGMACSIPTHNLGEVVDACVLLADNPDATLKQIMRRLPAPDFPLGGIIVNPEALQEAYKTGKGNFYLQAKYTVEPRPGNTQAIVVTELPYGVGPSKIIEQIEEAVVEKGVITDITENPVNLSDKKGLRLEIKVKRGGNVQKLLADLMKYTSMRITVNVNMTVLVDRYPRVVSLKEALLHFVEFRLEVVRKRLEKEFRDKERTLRRELAVLAALDVIDQVVKIIRGSKDDDESKAKLMKLLKYVPYGKKRREPITSEQAEWILSMQLRRLNQLNRLEIEERARQLTSRLDEIKAILESENGVRDIVKDELREVKRVYGTPRKTSFGGEVVIDATGEGRGDVAVVSGPAQDVVAYFSSAGMALAAPRKGKLPARSPLNLGNTRLVSVLETRTDKAAWAFTERGLCYRVNLADLGVESGRGKGRAAVALGRDDAVVSVLPIGEASHYAFVTARGELKRIEATTIQNAHAGGVVAYKVKEGDRVVSVLPHGESGEQAEAIISTAEGVALRLDLSQINPVKTGNAGGVAGVRLKGDDTVVALSGVTGGELLIFHETGFAKRVPLSDYPQKGRATGGVQSAFVDKPLRGGGPAGKVIFAATVGDDPRGFTASGHLLEVDRKKIERGKRAQVSKQSPYEPLAGLVRLAVESD